MPVMAANALVSRLTRRWRKQSCTITEDDTTFKTVYLGNTVTQWAKGSGSVDKPLATLWRNYCQSSKPDIEMRVTVTASGLKATTREHGLTEYWSHRVTFSLAHPSYPKMFCWVYRHEGRKMKPELRCHAVLCSSEAKARLMERQLIERLHQALVEFRKEKQLRQNARLSVVSVLYPTTPRRKVCLMNGGANYRPPLERSKSAPKLGSIEEDREGEARAAREDARRWAAAAAAAAAGREAAIAAAELVEPRPSATPASPRPRAFSEPLVPPPTVSIDPHAGASSDTDESATSGDASDSDTASQHSSSATSVPSDPTADSDWDGEPLQLLTTAAQCRVYHVQPPVSGGGDGDDSPRLQHRLVSSDVRLQVHCLLQQQQQRAATGGEMATWQQQQQQQQQPQQQQQEQQQQQQQRRQRRGERRAAAGAGQNEAGDSDDSVSDESGYADEVTPPARAG